MNRKSIKLVAVVVLLAVLSVIGAAAYFVFANQDLRPGCHQSDGVLIARYNRDCSADNVDGYFKIPLKYVEYCNIVSANAPLNRYVASSGGALNIVLPVTELLPDISGDLDASIHISVDAGENNNAGGCFFDHDDGLWQELLINKNKDTLYEKLVSYGGRKYKIEGFSYPDMGTENTRVPEHIRNGAKANNKYDIFLETDATGHVVQLIRCRRGAECNLSGNSPMLNSRYGFDVRFPSALSSHVFQIMEEVPLFFEKYYLKNQQNKRR